MRIEPFGVEQWMNAYETTCAYNLAETCVASLTVAELLELTGQTDHFAEQLGALHLTYGAIEGSDRLRHSVAGLYDGRAPADVTITHGAIGANHLVYLTVVEPGDRVVSVVPTYQQHVSVPRSLGAEVITVGLREVDDWALDLDQLRDAVGSSTKLIALTNPNNPTGALLGREELEQIAAIARSVGAWVLCDEVYRGIDQDDPGVTASIADVYERGISTGSMSKAFSLAGLRLGWVVAGPDLLGALSLHRDYSTISVGMIDDLLAAIALEHSDQVLARSRSIVRTNLSIVDEWISGVPSLSYVRPRSGTTALLRHAGSVSSRDLCLELLERTGVMLTPGSTMGMEGHLRLGYAPPQSVLEDGLGLIARHLGERS